MRLLINWVLLDVLGFGRDSDSIDYGLTTGGDGDSFNFFLPAVGLIIFFLLLILTVLEIKNYKKKMVNKHGKRISTKSNVIFACIADVVFLVFYVVHLVLLLSGY